MLAPLGTTRDETWITDALDTYRLSKGVSKRLTDTYDAGRVTYGWPAWHLRPHPSEDDVVHESGSWHKDRLRAELATCQPELVVSLGNAAFRVMGKLLAAGPERLEVVGYGERLNVGLGGRAIEWLPLAHPAAPQRYQEAHQDWAQRRRRCARLAGPLNIGLPGGMAETETAPRNPHAGRPFTDDDATIAAALEDLSVPALLCSLVHMTGDPSWIRTEIRPQASTLNDYQGSMSPEMMAEARRLALPAIVAFRDGGCVLPPPPSDDVIREMMAFLACEPVADDVAPMFLEDLHFDGADAGAITWGDEIPDDVRADAHTIVIGCGEAGLLAGIRLSQAGIPFTIIEKNGGPGGTWWENRYPGARVDIGSHFYCYSFEPADHWTEYFSQHPELRAYFDRVMHKYEIEKHCRFNTKVESAEFDDDTGRWTVTVTNPDGSSETLDARAIVSAVGALNQPRMPDIPGMDDFAGPSFHSARWDPSVDYRGKKFALVGAGASGFQIAPTIADDVEQLYVFQRTAQWVFPNPNYHRKVPDGERWAMRHLPFYGRWFRFITFYPGSGLTIERSRIDPNYDDGGLAISESNRETRELFADADARAARR